MHACEYFCPDGTISWTDWGEADEEFGISWEGMEASRSGDTVGMLLNLDEGTLAVYKNNHRLGVMKDGLSGSYCWYVGVLGGATVAIKRGEHPRTR